ncbi:MAG: hypothetical protein IJQ80_08800, partial [Clostridia bacterium]|nr:hypothetical protein [Clostridia bacterium]
TEYKYGVDWTVTADGKFQVIASGSIPKIAYSSHYAASNPSGSNNWQPKVGGGFFYYSEGMTFHNRQLAITYTHDDAWEGFTPESKIDVLSGTYDKLVNKQHITAVFYGDSITFGCNASGSGQNLQNTTPYMPKWADMVIDGLKAKYGYNDISYVNTAVGGTLSTWGVEEVQTRVVQYTPDLVFIGFGMNDGAGGSATTPAQFKTNIQSIINAARAANPNCEFILIASIVANPESAYAGIQEQYLPMLEQLEAQNTGVAVANMMTFHKELLQIKKYADMTGNNINHPNDFFIRYYAQNILTELSVSAVVDLANTKAAAIRTLNNYVNPADYRAEERAQLQSIIASATTTINAAETASEIRTAVNAAKAEIDALKTDAEYEAENTDFTNLRFNNAATMALVSNLNNMTSSLGSGYATFTSTGGDPFFKINYETGNASANVYKYVTIVYNVPSTVTNTTNTQVFFTAGSVTAETEDASTTFTVTKGGWAYQVLNMSSASYWTGKIHGIRIDPFTSYLAGDSFQLYSIGLSATAADADSYGSRITDLLSGNYKGAYEGVQFDTASEISRLSSVGGTKYVGDVDSTGTINTQDYSKIKKIVACISVPNIDEDLADTNRDGKVSAKDLLLMKKHIAGVITLPTIEGSSVTISYSQSAKGASLDADAQTGSVVIDLSDKGASADDLKYVSIVYKNTTGAAIPATVNLMRGGSDVASSSAQFTARASAAYISDYVDLSDVTGWSGAIDAVKITFTGSGFVLGGVIFSELELAASDRGTTKALSLNRMTGNYTPTTGQSVVPLNDTTTMASFENYNAASNNTYTYPSALTFKFDRQPDEKFDRVTLRYTSSANVRGTIAYNVDGTTVRDEFFLEGATSEKSFSTLIPSYTSGKTACEIMSVTLYPISGSAPSFSLKGITTEDMTNYSGEIYMQNSKIKVGVLLSMGGGISYYEELDDGDARYSNLLNRYDVGRLVQQSYYGINQSPYVMGDMGGTPWRYNPVQGGDVHNNASQLVDLQVTDTAIYVKVRPMDWGHNNHKTPSYMENWYTLYDSFIKVDNRFVDYSTYTHTAGSQELPAFYTVSALGTFCMYTGSSPWTGGAYSSYPNLGFWAGNSSQNYAASSEGWYAWIDGTTGFGIGLYVPNVSRVLAGRFYAGNASYVASYSPDENPTNYFAPLRTMTLKAGKALTYSYLICAGPINNIRSTFNANRGLVNNSALSSY